MRDQKILKLISKLPRTDVKAFGKYLIGVHAEKHNLCRLFFYLKKYYPNFDSEHLSAERINMEVYGGRPLDRKFIGTEFSKLGIDLRKFLVWKYQDEFTDERDFILLQVYKKYNLQAPFNQQIEKMERETNKIVAKDSLYWLKKLRLAHEFYFDPRKDQILMNNEKLVAAMSHLDVFYASTKVKYAVEFYNRFEVKQEPIPAIKHLDDILKTNATLDPVLLQCYKLSLLLFKYRKEESYTQLKENILTYTEDIAPIDRYVFFSYLLNHNAYLSKQNNVNNIHEIFNLYQSCIDKSFFMSNDIFNNGHFTNIVDIACKLNKFEWAVEFIKKYSPNLLKTTRKETVIICQALIHFFKKEYQQVIDLFSVKRYKSLHNNVRYKLLNIAVNYEIYGDEEHVRMLCTAFEVNVRRNKELNQVTQKGLINFCKMVKRLLTFQVKKEELRKEFNALGVIFFKGWIAEKIETLESG